MKKTKFVAAALAASLVLSSCIGSFKTFNSLKDWNNTIGSKFANEVVFLALHIIPVYEICYLADILVVNSIEFWNGGDAFSMKNGETKEMEFNGTKYRIAKKSTKCHIEEVGNETNCADLVFDRQSKTWSLKNGDDSLDIMRMLNDNKVIVNVPTKGETVVDMSDSAEYENMLNENESFAVK